MSSPATARSRDCSSSRRRGGLRTTRCGFSAPRMPASRSSQERGHHDSMVSPEGIRNMIQPLTPKDLWPLSIYEGVRDQFRKEVIEAKKDRRVQAGPEMTLVFENRTTVKFQVQEISRIERITDAAQIARAVQAINSLIPVTRWASAIPL